MAGILYSGCSNTLSAFYLESSGISDSGAKKVADAVRGCTRLFAFYLCGMPISGETVTYILESMANTSTIRSVNLCAGEISKEQMDSCLDRLQQSGVARQVTVRFQCGSGSAKSMYEEFAAEWSEELYEFKIVHFISDLFNDEVILGVPK